MINRTVIVAALLVSGASALAVDPKSGLPNRPMVHIKGGCFVFGPPDDSDLGKRRFRCLSDYFIDKAEVTVDEYLVCVRAGICAAPKVMPETAQRAQQVGNYPVGGISWRQSKRYCEWGGKRLPTFEEWERAARGPKMFRYPWANRPPNRRQARYPAMNDASLGLRPVCTMPLGNSPEGLCDMADNIPEYVDAWIDNSNGWDVRSGPPDRKEEWTGRIVRGYSLNAEVPEAWRYLGVGSADKVEPYFGMRCAKDAEKASPANPEDDKPDGGQPAKP